MALRNKHIRQDINHKVLTKTLLLTILIGVSILNVACQTKSKYEQYTPKYIAKGSGIILDYYEVIEKYDDKDLQEDGWGQQVWLVKQDHPIRKQFLDSLVTNDNRWDFQNDARQQYFFYEDKGNSNRTIYISTDDSLISLSYEWKK